MDSDDLYLPGALQKLVAAAEAASGMAGAHGLAEYIDAHGAPMLPGEFSGRGRKRIGMGADGKLREWAFSEPTCFRTLLFANVTYPPGLVLTRRVCYEKAGLFDPRLPPVEDWDMLARLSRHGDFLFLNEVIVLYRNYPGNTSMKNMERAMRKVREFHAKTYRSPENTPEQAEIAKQVWRELQWMRLRGKLDTVKESLAARNVRQACFTLAKTYVEIHRAIRGYPTPSGL